MLYIKQTKFKREIFITILISICLIFVSTSPALAVVGLDINYSTDLASNENLYYGFMTDASNIGSSLLLLQSPVGTDRFRVTGAGTTSVYILCDENGVNCKDLSDGWASLGVSDGYIGDIQAEHTAGGQLNMSTNYITGNNLRLLGASSRYVEVKSNSATYGLIIRDYNSTAWGNIDANSGYLAIGYNNDNGPIFIDDDDEVGIGTNNPSYKLDVDGTVSVGSNFGPGSDVLSLHNTNIHGVNWLQFNNPGSGIQWNGGASTINLYVVDDSNDNILRTNGNFRVDNSMGIGTSVLPEKLMVAGWIGRTAHNNGALCGSYNNVGANSTMSNPIYTIGSAYKPAASTLGGMYGIGYTHTNATFTPGAVGGGVGWGMYVASAGVSRIFLNASNGGAYFAGNIGIGVSDTAGYRLRVAGNARVDSRLYVGMNDITYIEAVPGDDVVKVPNLDSNNGLWVRGIDGLIVLAGGAGIYENVGINIAQRSDTYRLAMGGHIHMNNGSIHYAGQLHFTSNGIDSTTRFLDIGNDNYLRFKWHNATNGGIQFYDGNDQLQGYIYSSGDNTNFGLLDADGNWGVRVERNMAVYNYVDNMNIGRITASGLTTYAYNEVNTYLGNLTITTSASTAEFNTDRPYYYFNTGIIVDTGWIGSNSGNFYMRSNYATNRVTIEASTGNVGINTTNPDDIRALHVVGNFSVTGWSDSNLITAAGLSGVGNRALNANAAGTITLMASDERLKENIETIDNPIEKLMKLRGVYFNWKDGPYSMGEERDMGMIAQEVEEVIPEAAREGSEGYEAVDYSKLTGFLVEVEKEQQSQLEKLMKEVEELKRN